MKAFHNDEAIKKRYLARVRAHRAADEIIKGRYWEEGKGCAVGCTLHSSRHEDYETELGIPRLLARLEDRIFEGMPNHKAKDWPVEFLEAIPVGANLSLVWPRFAIWLLTDEKDGVIKFADEKGKAAIKGVAALFERILKGEEVSAKEWNSARKAAYAATAADAYDTAYAAYAAYAATAAAAYVAARQQAYYIQSEKLLELLRDAK